MKTVAIFGGSFSPPHIGHLHAVQTCMNMLQPDEFLIIPALLPPHKQLSDAASSEDRLHMCRLAFSDINGVTVSDMEIARGGTSYTVYTLRELAAPDVQLLLLCGTDMFLSLDTWYCTSEICRLAHLVYIRRENDPQTLAALLEKEEEYRVRFGARVTALASAAIEISSTEVRNALKGGGKPEVFLQPRVLDYIKERGLYQ